MKQNSVQRIKAKKKVKKSDPELKKAKPKKPKNNTNSVKTKHEYETIQKQSFKEVINKFKKLFDDKITLVKEQSQPFTQRSECLKKRYENSKKITSKHYNEKHRPKGFSQIFSTMEAKLSKQHGREKVGKMKEKKKGEKSNRLSRSKSKEQSRVKSLSKSISAIKKLAKTQKPRLKGEVKRINTIQTQNEKTTRRVILQSDLDRQKSKGSIIIYNIDDDMISFERPSFQKQKSSEIKLMAIQYIEATFHQFLQRKRFEDKITAFHTPKNQSSRQTENNTIKIEQMFKEQEAKWLQLKESLQKIKVKGKITNQLDSIIFEAENNFMELKNMEIKESRRRFESERNEFRFFNLQDSEEEKKNEEDFSLEEINLANFQVSKSDEKQEEQEIKEEKKEEKKQSPKSKREEVVEQKRRKKLSYDEAPLQIKKILKQKRKSFEEMCEESQKKSKEMNKKKLEEDINLMQFFSGNSSIEREKSTVSEERKKKPKIQLSDKAISGENGKNVRNLFKKEKSSSEEHLFEKKESPVHIATFQLRKKESSNSESLLLNQSPLLVEKVPSSQESIDNIENQVKIFEQEQLKIEEISEVQQREERIKSLTEIITNSLEEGDRPPVTPTNIERVKFDGLDGEEEKKEEGQNFILSKPKYMCREECQEQIVDYLAEQMIFELTKRMNEDIIEFFNSKNIQIDEYYQENYENQPKIQCDESFIMLTVHKMLEFMKKLPNNDFFHRISQPLGLRSYEMLSVLRKIRYGISQEDDDNEFQQSGYRSIIDLEHITSFQLQQTDVSQTNYTGYQQFFDQAIFDTMNLALDEMRPFGKHGYPPICFESEFQPPSYENIYSQLMGKLKDLSTIRLGLMHYEIDSEAVMRTSLDKFTKECVKEFDDEWLWQKEGEFEIYLELMQELEEIIIIEELLTMREVLGNRQR